MSKEARNNDIQILDALIVLARYKFLVISLVVSITLISLVISLVWPQTFKSTATILPPSQHQPFTGITSILGSGLPINLGSSPQINSETILTILNSRQLRVDLVHEFDLFEVYNSQIMEELLMSLNETIRIEERREGGFGFNPIISVQISVTDREPERAQQMTSFIVTRLDETINQINRENATEQFRMIEQRYLRNLEDLEKAELNLKEFQETYGIIEVEEQAKTVINALAEIKARSIETEIALNVLSQSVSENNPELRRLRRTLAELERQYDSYVQQSEEQAREAQVMPAILDLPDLALRYYRLYREVTVQNKIFENLYPQYDIQKLQLETEKRGIQIVDQAHLPTYKDAPKRAFIVLGGMVFSIFLAFLIVFYRHTVETGRKTNSPLYRKIVELKKNLISRRKKGEDIGE